MERALRGVAVGQKNDCGLSGIPSLESFLEDGRNALVVPPDDDQALAHGIWRVLSDPRLDTELAEGGRKTTQQCSWDLRVSGALRALGRGTPADESAR